MQCSLVVLLQRMPIALQKAHNVLSFVSEERIFLLPFPAEYVRDPCPMEMERELWNLGNFCNILQVGSAPKAEIEASNLLKVFPFLYPYLLSPWGEEEERRRSCGERRIERSDWRRRRRRRRGGDCRASDGPSKGKRRKRGTYKKRSKVSRGSSS